MNITPEQAKKVAEMRARATAETNHPHAAGVSLDHMRVYGNRVAGGSFHFKSGKTAYFTGGWYETSDEQEIAELDEIANKVPTIFTMEKETEVHYLAFKQAGNLATLMNAAAERSKQAGILGGVVTTQPSGVGGNIETSSIEHTLRSSIKNVGKP